jgi:predicted amidohydrolase
MTGWQTARLSKEERLMQRFRLAAVQMNPLRDDLDHNLQTHVRIVQETAEAGCRLVVFPELSVTGHYGDEKVVQFGERAGEGRIFRTMHAEARKHNITIAYGLCEAAHGTYYNSYALVGPEGLIGVQRKMHASHDEYFSFRMGRSFEVFDLGFCRVGTLICYDSKFFEGWRVLALKEAEVILLPHAIRSGWGTEVPAEELVRKLRAALEGLPGYEGDYAREGGQAVEVYTRENDQVTNSIYAKANAVFAAFGNQVGYNGHSTHLGGAHIVAPTGELLARSEPLLDDLWISAELDPQVQETMRRNPWCTLKTRRPEVYGELTRLI